MVLDLLLASYLVKGTALLAAVALVLGARPRPLLLGLVFLAAGLLFVGLLVRTFPLLGKDYGFFWEVGGDVWAGRDPYAEGFDAHPFLNPPPALPLFALFALAPFRVSFLLWTALNALGCLALLPLSQHALVAQEQERPGLGRPAGAARQPCWALPPLVLAGLIPALLVSDASLVGFYVGQLGLLEAVALLAALGCQARGWPVRAGVWLALATVKVTTMVPFLLLFGRRADRRTWFALAVTTLALCLLTGGPAGLPGRFATLLKRVGQLESPGQVNDYSFEGTQSVNMLGFEHAFYRLGMRDRRAIRAAGYLALAALGAWVACRVLGKGRLPRAAACSLVALYSVVFLYHRSYDTVILALPLVYCAGQARSAPGGRPLFACSAVCVLLVWYLDIDRLRALQSQSPGWGVWGRLVQAAVLPYATWLVVLAMFALVAGVRRSDPPAGCP